MALRRRRDGWRFPATTFGRRMIAGTPVVRTEDERFLTGRASYVEDIDVPGALHATYVRATVAHARIRSVDTTAARRAPGVAAVLTAADVGLAPAPPAMAFLNQGMARPWLALDVVRFVGEPLAVVLSETRAQGMDAAALVAVDYDPRPAVVDPEDATADGAPLLFSELGTNVALDLQFGRDESLFDGCQVVVRQRIVNQRLAPCPLEGRSAAAAWGDDGRLTHWSSTQAPHAVRDVVADLLGVDAAMVRVIAPDVGGAFGSKIGLYPEETLLGWLARHVGRPVRWTETRSESMVGLGHGRAQVQHVEIGGRRDGRVEAYRLTVVQDAGAYPSFGAGLPVMTRTMVNGVYDIARVEFNSTSVVTNTTPTVAYRGAGRPEATAAVERAIDCFASEIGMDPAEVRRANLVAADAFPYNSPVGTVYDSGDYRAALDRALAEADYVGLREEQQ
ncbi:MAG: xanthine dehydrogenase family protein molybdopterin-binding subunit, partial [Acidimicrobiales bacterium]